MWWTINTLSKGQTTIDADQILYFTWTQNDFRIYFKNKDEMLIRTELEEFTALTDRLKRSVRNKPVQSTKKETAMTLRELQKVVNELLESMDDDREVRLQGIAGSSADVSSVVMSIDEEVDEEFVLIKWEDDDEG